MRFDAPITETDTRLIDRNTGGMYYTCVSTLFHVVPGSAIYVNRSKGVWTANSIEFKWVETISSPVDIISRVPSEKYSQLLWRKWFYLYFVNPLSDIGSYGTRGWYISNFIRLYIHSHTYIYSLRVRRVKVSHYCFHFSQLFRSICRSLYLSCLNTPADDLAP